MNSLYIALAALVAVCAAGGPYSSPTSTSYYNNPTNTSCAVKANVSDASMLGAMEWACSAGGVDCTPIQPGGSHFYPNTTLAHANWVFNEYFWMDSNSANTESCDFGGIAELTCPAMKAKTKTIRGANIGGWLVLEPWITPSMFQQFVNLSKEATAEDEYTFCSILGYENASAQLQEHWETWATESDFQQLASFGLNTVRIPVGWWIIVPTAPFVEGGLAYLDKAISWAQKYGLDVLIDLHGAPGSQNGFDNSGRKCGVCAGDCPANFSWDLNQTNIDVTVTALSKLAARYGNESNILGIELLNEPSWVTDLGILRAFYEAAYAAVRDVSSLPIFFHDSFRYNVWRQFMTEEQGYTDVYMDTHIYQAFSPSDITQTTNGHLMEACGYQRVVDYIYCMEHPVIVGEWSLGTTDCPPYLLGFEIPPTAPGLGVPCPHNNTDEFLTQYANTQINSWEHGAGWIFWNFKTETQPKWSYIDAVANGWLPANVNPPPADIASACDGLDPVAKRSFRPPQKPKVYKPTGPIRGM